MAAAVDLTEAEQEAVVGGEIRGDLANLAAKLVLGVGETVGEVGAEVPGAEGVEVLAGGCGVDGLQSFLACEEAGVAVAEGVDDGRVGGFGARGHCGVIGLIGVCVQLLRKRARSLKRPRLVGRS